MEIGETPQSKHNFFVNRHRAPPLKLALSIASEASRDKGSVEICFSYLSQRLLPAFYFHLSSVSSPIRSKEPSEGAVQRSLS